MALLCKIYKEVFLLCSKNRNYTYIFFSANALLFLL